MKRIISALAVAFLLLVGLPGLASAHAKLVSSTPADGAQIALTEAPTQITLTFSEEVGKDLTTITVMHADGATMSDGTATINFDNPKLATVKLKSLIPGIYTVKWHAVTTDDNGQSDGTFTFTIVNNTGGGTMTGGGTTGGTTSGGTMTDGGTTSGGTTSGGTTSGGGNLPTTGTAQLPLGLLALGALALLLLTAGYGLRRAQAAGR